MANYHNGNRQYGQPGNQQRYEAYTPPSANPPLRRMPSYNAGDDASLFAPAAAQTSRAVDVNQRYTTRASIGEHPGTYAIASVARDDYADPRYSHIPSATSPPRARAQSQSAYQYQYASATGPVSPTQASYNPQQYALPTTTSQQPTGYSPLSYSSSNSYGNSNNSNTSPTHQPYNPAAYQAANIGNLGSPTIQRQSSMLFAQTPLSPYGSSHPSLPPPPPPRGPDHPYGSRPSPQYTSTSPGTQFGFQTPHLGQSSFATSSYNLASPTSPTAAYASGSGSLSSIASYNSRPYGGVQIPSHLSHPSRLSDPSRTPSVDEEPPEPPAHLSSGEAYDNKPYTSVRPPGRSLPTPPLHQSQSPLMPRRTDTLTRHPQARPLPGPPMENDDDTGSYGYVNGSNSAQPGVQASGYDDLVKEVEAAMPNAPWTGGNPPGYRPLHIDVDSPGAVDRSGSTGSTHSTSGLAHLSPDERHTHTNGNMATGTGQYVNYDAYSDDSDAEAEAGLAMLRMADEEERAQAERLQERSRRETNDSTSPGLAKPPSVSAASPVQTTSAGLYSSYGGNNYLGHSPYDDKTLGISPYGDESDHAGHQPTSSLASRHSSTASREDRAEYSDEYDYPPIGDDFSFPFPQLPSTARVDAGGTGGLSEPSAYNRRMSFDYGDETDGSLSHRRQSHHSGSEGSINGEEFGDFFFHPGMRPLPPPPEEPTDNATLIPHLLPAGTYRNQEPADNLYPPSYIPAPSPGSYGAAAPSPTQFSRSTSLTSHPIGPRADPPIRSKTDADKAKYKQQQEMLRQSMLKLDPSLDPSSAAIPLDLPIIPAGRRKKFHPSKLSSEDFRRCPEPWALSSILTWIRDLTEDETDLKEHAVADAIVALFTHKVPTMNIADAETLAARVVENMLDQEALVKDEEWVKFGSGTMSGVLFQITGTGCYSTVLHEQDMDAQVVGRCYSHHCMRTLRKVNLRAQAMEPQKKVEDWVTFYKVTKEILEGHPKKEIDRQNNLHEIVTTEDSFIGQLDVLRELYRDRLATSEPSIIPPKRANKFLNDVFGKVDAVKRVNEDYLLAQLKYRQKEQGPFIVGFSDIFREWIRKAKAVYVSYAETFPYANYLIRKEAERNVVFRQFLSTARDHKLSNRLSWDTFLKAPITRIQRYTLLLSTVHRNMLKESEEKTNLSQAIEEIKIVALECDNKVGEMSKKVDLRELASKLQLRPDMRKRVELNLDFLGREIVFRGDLQRPGSRTRFLVDTHAILFDHFLVLAKLSVTRDTARTIKLESYDVSKLPIPMDLLVLESTQEDPVVKSAVRGVVAAGPAPQPGVLANANAERALVPATVLENTKDGGVLYPFKVKHLGLNETYILYAPSSQNRRDWCQKITEAKTKHAASLYAQNAEPFHLRVLADTAFASSDSSPSSNGAVIKGTPLHRAVKEVEKQYPASARPTPICRAAVHCATVFEQPAGRKMCAIGTEHGVYVSEYNDPRGWSRTIAMARVTQIAVLEEFNLFLLIADKSLIAYHLDVVCPASGVPVQASNDSARRAPQKLSGNREVGFFAAGHMKDRTLVMYKKRDGLSSTYKILEPVLQKSATSRSRFFSSRRSQTEFFREYDEFYIPAESYGLNLFHSSLAISTQKGIEILTLDKKQTWSVPEFRTEAQEAQQHLLDIARRITGLRPLGMFRLSDAEFLVTYTECAVYVNQHGDVSRSVVLEFVGRAHSACLYGKFLILFNDDFVEVRNAMNGRLRQVIHGHNVVCLDDGSRLPGSGANSIPTSTGDTVNLSSGTSNGASLASQGRTVKICMQHPNHPRNLIVLELIENEGSKD
ncbi:putative Rho guanyl nucleotide exchange factor [Aspergillus undulatus]|uniref:putative Rho guanyl nucleotide exchange factor n=1 Tax=Aspergillus undulatus TaxID=1810928 RepID=UPI003CCCFCC2